MKITKNTLSLEEKLKSINKPAIHSLKKGKDKTIPEFWKNCVEPMLPKKDIVIKWFRLLKRYVKEKNAVFAIRNFGSWDSKKDSLILRRGFYNTTNQKYSFFYTDNFFTAYFAKMAIDGYIPKYSEFKKLMLNRKFPARFGRSTTNERIKAAYDISGKLGGDPGFGKAGYKISHIINTGKDFNYKNVNLSISEICNKYFPRGKYKDWQKDKTGKYYVRRINVIAGIPKKLLIAHFLRMTCPLNYIFTPKKSLQKIKGRINKNDIGESSALQIYANKQLEKKYGDIYNEFKKLTMFNDIISEKTNENFKEITYNL